MGARIYRPAKSATQSGQANTSRWVLEFERVSRRTVDRLMGWTGGSDMGQQVRLTFATKDEAVAFAERNGLDHQVVEPHERQVRLKSYADNFRYDRPR